MRRQSTETTNSTTRHLNTTPTTKMTTLTNIHNQSVNPSRELEIAETIELNAVNAVIHE